MRPPHIAPAIAVTPHRLLGAIILLAVVVALAAVAGRRRSDLAGRMVDEPLERLNGFHIFGPEEDDEPPIHVPMLRARPAVPGSPAALRRAAPTNGTENSAPRTPPSPSRTGHVPAGASRAARLPAPAAPRAAAPRAAAAPAAPRSRPAPAAAQATAKPAAPARSQPGKAAAAPTPTPRSRRAAQDPTLSWSTPRPAKAAAEPPASNHAATASRDLTGSPSRHPQSEREPFDVIPGDGDILLVEDDVTIATMYQMLLSTKGYVTRHAHDGVEGIAMVRDERPALILLDMMMPRMDGIQFLEALRGWPKTRSIPVVVLSNVGDRHLVDRALALGAVEYLVKAQTRPQVLVGALPHWLRGNRALTTLS
jgi:CheY-like chemotaxis protein